MPEAIFLIMHYLYIPFLAIQSIFFMAIVPPAPFSSMGVSGENLQAGVRLATDCMVKGQTAIPPAIYQDAETRLMEKLIGPWLLIYTNQYRKENGVDTLLYDACLQKAAANHTNYLYNEARVTNQFTLVHQQTQASKWFTGKSPSDRALAAGCKKYCGENALYTSLPTLPPKPGSGQVSLEALAKKIAHNMVFERWHKSSGHRANMLTKGYTTLGVSVAIAKQITGTGDESSRRMVAFGLQLMAY